MNQEKTTRRKILFLVTKSNFGGAQRYVYDLATNLPEDYFEVVVAFGTSGKAGEAEGRLSSMLKETGVRTILIPDLGRDASLLYDWRSFLSILRLLNTEKPDVLHLNSSKAGGLGALAGRVRGVQNVIFTAHGWPFWEERRILSRGLIFFLSWLTVLFSHSTICISEFDKKHVQWMPFARKKLRVIYNGLPSYELLSREDARKEIRMRVSTDIHANDVWVATIAELHPNKNLISGIEAVAAHNRTTLPKIFYVIIGSGELEKIVEAAASKTGGYVVLAGFVGDARRYLSAFDVFVLPSKKEGVPYVVLEAGYAELPVVASAVGGIPEVVEDGVSGILTAPSDVHAIETALSSLASFPDVRTSMGRALRKRVRSKFSMERMITRTVLLYRT